MSKPCKNCAEDHDTWGCPMAKKPMAYPSVRGESYADALDYIAELEAERDALKVQLANTVLFEEHAEAVEDAYKEGIYDARSMYHLGWSDSAAKARLDERRRATT